MMQYLGHLRGAGTLIGGTLPLGRVDYDFDTYLTRPGEVIASGEVRMGPDGLDSAFGRNDLSLQTDDGLTLGLRFSGKRRGAPNDVAHADIKGGLPDAGKWRRQK